jgi:hypothetical protein
MKPILTGFAVFALAVGGHTEHVAVCRAAENPDAGRKREFRVVVADVAEFQRRLADAAAEVEIGQVRVARMHLLSQKCAGSYRDEVDAAKEDLRIAEMALEKLRTDRKRFPFEFKGSVPKRAFR